jgi:hypothetical protein
MSNFNGLVTLLLIGSIWLKPDWWVHADATPASAHGIQEQLFLSGMLLASMPPLMWLETIFWVGWGCLRSVPMMADIFLRCWRGWVLLAVVAFCLWFWWLAPSASTDPSPYRIEMSVALIVTIALLWLQPPFVLVLGVSAGRTGRVLGNVSAAMYPFRVVALLDTTLSGTTGGVGAFSPLTDNLRTVSPDRWRSVVDSLADLVSIIVIDARTESELVVYEVGEMLRRPDRLRRTVFVVGSNGEAAALEAHNRTAASPDLWTATESRVRAALKSSGLLVWP